MHFNLIYGKSIHQYQFIEGLLCDQAHKMKIGTVVTSLNAYFSINRCWLDVTM